MFNPEEQKSNTTELPPQTDEGANSSIELPAQEGASQEYQNSTNAELENIREVIRTDRRADHYQRVFGKDIELVKGRILDIAAGDSNFAEETNRSGGQVIRLDATYQNDPPEYKEGAVAGLAQHLPFADNSFEEVVNSFLMEHIKPEETAQIVREMVRVTQPGGVVKIYPSYYFLGDLKSPYSFISTEKLSGRLFGVKTLLIKKDPNITDEQWDNIIPEIVSEARFVPKIPFVPPALFQTISRWLMKKFIANKGVKEGTNRLTKYKKD